MHLLNFLKYFFTEELVRTGDKVIFVSVMWIIFLIPIASIAIWLHSLPILFWFIGCSAAIVFFGLVSFFFAAIYMCYREWEARVFEKLRGN